ncbi:MAG: AAA family ATPase, partial [Fervidobacterium sp.]|nr:AAA family ATPase [Fervidobacterium sp.]
ITKYTKAGVFSTLNNLADISLHEDFSQMLGYTKQEIEHYFSEYIDIACQKLGMSKEYLLEQLEKYYGGFSFDGKHSVFNPFAVLLFFLNNKFLAYWHDTSQPKFLYDYLVDSKVKLEDVLKKELLISYTELTSREIEESLAKSFLVQAGYLTFAKEIDSGLYQLKIPNIDAGQSLTQMVLEINYKLDTEVFNQEGKKIRESVRKEEVDKLIEGIKQILGRMSYRLNERIKRALKKAEDKLSLIESHYEIVISGILMGSGIYHEIEVEVAGGIIDI